jgi:trypsin
LGRKVSLVGAGKVFLPPGYSCRKNEKDIALIQLKDAISGAVPIRLASRTDAAKYLRVGAGSVSATGWGLTQVDGWKSRNLLKVDIPVTDYGACKAHYGGSLPANAICAGAAGKDTCTGDSGGPLYTGSGKDAIQLGVVSFGDSCGQAKIPGVYTPVAEYRDWIDEVRKPKPCTSEDIRNGRC